MSEDIYTRPLTEEVMQAMIAAYEEEREKIYAVLDSEEIRLNPGESLVEGVRNMAQVLRFQRHIIEREDLA